MMRVTSEVVVWDRKINLSDCLAENIQNLIEEHLNYYIEGNLIYLNFPKTVYWIDMMKMKCEQFNT